MTSVFISYSRKDAALTYRLTAEFEKRNLKYWIDRTGIDPTVEWWKAIETGIEQADCFLFLLSTDSAKSEVCQREIEHAVKNGKRLIPMVIRDTAPQDVPVEISKLNWIFCREGQDDFEVTIAEMLSTVTADYSWVQFHTNLQVKAIAWGAAKKESSRLLQGKELQEAETRLAASTQNDPAPTELQRQYIRASRNTRTRNRNLIVTAALGVLAALSLLTAYSIDRRSSASADEQEALARQLAAAAQDIDELQSSKPFDERELGLIVANLLAIQSLKLLPSADAASFLLNGTAQPFPGESNLKFAPVTLFNIDDGSIMSACFSPNGMYVVTGGSDGTARVWEAASGNEVARMTHDDLVESVAFSPDGKYVVSAGWDGTVRVWEAATGQEITRFKHEDLNAVAFSPNGNYVASGSNDDTVRVWDIASGDEVARTEQSVSRVNALAFSPNGKYVVSGDRVGLVRVWDAATGDEIAHIMHEPDPGPRQADVLSVAFSPDGKYVVSGGAEPIVRVWEATSGNEIARLIHEARVWTVGFSTDGKYVVTGSSDGTARVWEAASGNEVARMTHASDGSMGHAAVYAAAFSPDGNYVVSGSSDGTARIWDASTGLEVARVVTPFNTMKIVAFSSDGKTVLSVSEDHSVRVWVWQAEDLLARACELIPRNLTRQEWEEYIGEALLYQAVCDNLPIEN